jgi:NAD(P)H-flavin reductase/truncated hemoglobin YjbI
MDALHRQGQVVTFSCRKGSCHICQHRAVSGTPPKESQKGIPANLRALGYFLPCICFPESDMAIEPPRPADLFSSAVVHKKELLSTNVARLLLEPAQTMDFRPGQFINLRRSIDGLTRSYSLAGLPDDYFLELHVKRMDNGAMSNWIFDALNEQDEIEIQGPLGELRFEADTPSQPLLLIAGGTGLAPLLGVLRDAIAHNHRGDIYLYHGSHTVGDIYLRRELIELAGEHGNLHYNACLSGQDNVSGMLSGRVDTVALSLHPDLKGWKVFIAGPPRLIQTASTGARAAGAADGDVLADSFEFKELRSSDSGSSAAYGRRDTDAIASGATETSYPDPDPELWAALDEGRLLSSILDDFYTRVYADERLSPFFRGVTKRRLVEKQFSFLKQIMTGVKIYFGDRPRNAHHWMVISNELFAYRENLMVSVLRAHALTEPMIARFSAIEESFRPDIVKDKPWNKLVNGIELPLDGFDEITMEVGTLCDGCNGEIPAGTKVRYHVRLGSTWCPACMASDEKNVKSGTHVT